MKLLLLEIHPEYRHCEFTVSLGRHLWTDQIINTFYGFLNILAVFPLKSDSLFNATTTGFFLFQSNLYITWTRHLMGTFTLYGTKFNLVKTLHTIHFVAERFERFCASEVQGAPCTS